jgi:hypothetical protein
MTTVGLIGSGQIGSAIARLAIEAGHQVVLSNSRGSETLADTVAEREGPAGRRGRHPRGTGHRNAVTASWRGPRYGPAVLWPGPAGVGRGHNAELVAVRIRQDVPCPAVFADRTPVSTDAPKPVTRRTTDAADAILPSVPPSNPRPVSAGDLRTLLPAAWSGATPAQR